MNQLKSLVLGLGIALLGFAGCEESPGGGGSCKVELGGSFSTAVTYGAFSSAVDACNVNASGDRLTIWDQVPSDVGFAAVQPSYFDSGAACGACLKITGPAGVRIVRVVNQCGSCASTDVDLDLDTFNAVTGDTGAGGRYSVTTEGVTCPVTGGITTRTSDAANAYYFAITLGNHTQPIASLQIKRQGTYRETTRLGDGVFTYAASSDTGATIIYPADIRVTDVSGNSVDVTVSTMASALERKTQQFPTCD